MRLRKSRPTFITAFALMALTPIGALAATSVLPNATASLTVAPHIGSESIDVSGHGFPSHALTITLVSTFSYDVPDVVLSRTIVVTDADGAFSAVISIASGFTRGSAITVYATTPAGASATAARYFPDAPNRGVVVPLDQVPKAVR